MTRLVLYGVRVTRPGCPGLVWCEGGKSLYASEFKGAAQAFAEDMKTANPDTTYEVIEFVQRPIHKRRKKAR